MSTGVTTRIVPDGDAGVRIERGAVLRAESGTRLVGFNGQQWLFEHGGRARVTDAFGTVDVLARVEPWTPTALDLADLAGRYFSAEAETEYLVSTEGGTLVLTQRPDRVVRLSPLYESAFSGPLGTIIFRRDPSGRANAFSVSQERVWDLRFERQDAPAARTGR